ncbi:MAG: hypothetical protein LBO74_11815 [Candidatus Symbiothrix sp.]|nr:hypothetical protein [Candidatus Symbiothrix sp.]
MVTPVAGGTATITVTTVDGSKTATCAVTVNIVRSGCKSASYFTQNGIKYYSCGDRDRTSCTQSFRPVPGVKGVMTGYTIRKNNDNGTWIMWLNQTLGSMYNYGYMADTSCANCTFTPRHNGNMTSTVSYACFLK